MKEVKLLNMMREMFEHANCNHYPVSSFTVAVMRLAYCTVFEHAWNHMVVFYEYNAKCLREIQKGKPHLQTFSRGEMEASYLHNTIKMET